MRREKWPRVTPIERRSQAGAHEHTWRRYAAERSLMTHSSYRLQRYAR